MNEDKWSLVKVLCTDGIERLGMVLEDCIDLTPERVLESGLHEEYAAAIIAPVAQNNGLEVFDNYEDYEADVM